MQQRATLNWWWLIPILLLAFWLGARDLNTLPVWGDERNSIRDAGGLFFGPLSPVEIWVRVATGNPWHSPGYFFVLAGWGALVGWTIPALRMLSLLLGLLAVAWTYRLGRDLHSAEAGIYSAAVLTTSMFFVYYLARARMYALMVVLSVFTVWVYFRIVSGRGRVSPLLWAGLLTGAVGLLYTHYFAPLLLVALGAHHLLFVQKDRRWWAVVGVMLLAGLLFVPWVGALLAGLERAASFEALHERAIGPLATLERLAFLFGNSSPALAVVTLALVVVALLQRERAVWRVGFITAALLVTLIGINAVVQVMHAGRLRYLLGLWGPLAVVVGVTLVTVRRLPFGRVLTAVLLTAWLGLGVYQVSARLIVRDTNGLESIYPMHRVAAALSGHVQVGDFVIHTIVVDELPDIDSPLNEYGPMRQFYFPPDIAYLLLQVETDDDQQTDAQADALDELGDRPRFWLAYQPDHAPLTLPELRADIDETYDLCRVVSDQPDLRVELYTRVPLCCAAYDRAEPTIAQYGDDIALTGVELLPAHDGELPVVTTWAVGGSVPVYTYSVALHAWDANGERVTQADFGLELPALSCQQASLPVRALPPGDYTLRATVYDWQTGARLPGQLADGSTGDLLPVATFRIDD